MIALFQGELESFVTLDSGRSKRRLKDDEGTRILEGLLQGRHLLGASAAALSNNWLCKRFTRSYTRSAHSRVVQRLLEVRRSRVN